MTTIEHSPSGTTVVDTERAMATTIKGQGFRWSSRQGLWYLNSTWHASTRLQRAQALHRIMTAAGYDVDLVVESSPAVTSADDVAAAFEAKQARAESRAEHLEAKAGRLDAQSDETLARARQMGDAIPFGQPILVGHHSEGRDRRYRERMVSTYDKAFEAAREAEEVARRAESAKAGAGLRSTLRYALNKVAEYEADRRRTQRKLDGSDPVHHGPAATGEYRERLLERATEQDAHIAFWKGQVAEREAAGERVWTRADFKPGDWAKIRGNRWMQVVKANPKTLALETGHMPWPLKYPYSDVVDRRASGEGERASGD